MSQVKALNGAMLYHYWVFTAVGGALVALALVELWFLGLREEELDEKQFTTTDFADIPITFTQTPDVYKRHIPLLPGSTDDTPVKADEFVRSGR